ncbi:hypothetical protein PITCH_A1260008 [uncultured Desulfobacterium sp.]|uniref:Uncharacterized protein n=1 Tax=uncultured Desulfobacterium sp. TaxID=201089 RepID=A0A445MRW7_9BACT|nr:hypothetical protein PITCH_A1260008 [uncultured Desulfobacterium sp.]
MFAYLRVTTNKQAAFYATLLKQIQKGIRRAYMAFSACTAIEIMGRRNYHFCHW